MIADPMHLPADLPEPTDDGAADHLTGKALPAICLPSSQGRCVDLSALPSGRTVIFAYPMTGRPGAPLPEGWNAIPGARGCTPQNCAIRDRHEVFRSLGVHVLAVSTQSASEQREMVDRLQIPYAVLSDADLRLTWALGIPTFEVEGLQRLRRLTMIVKDGVVEHVFYPVFPPDGSAAQVLDWLADKVS